MPAKMCPVCGVGYPSDGAFCNADGARLLPPDEAEPIFRDADPLVRARIAGRYRILKRIGEGGMGVVYLAEHEAIEKRVAVKVLKEPYAQKEEIVLRFQQEAKSASRVDHEGILQVFDYGRTDDGRFFLVMELLDGIDLGQLLELERPLDPVRVARLAIKMARALAAAHAKGVIHRDIKPENVFVRRADDGTERVKIVDFGIAQLRADGESASDPNAPVVGRKLTKTGVIFGTPEYMSPEQASGKGIDARVDVYALGVILYELLTGDTPFQGATFMAILSEHLMKPVPPLASKAPPGFRCSKEIEAVVYRALAKEPDERYRSAYELAEALLATPEGASNEARPSNVPIPLATRASTSTPPAVKKAAATVSGYSAARLAETAYDPDNVAARPSALSPGPALLSVEPPPKKSAVVPIALVAIAALGVGGYFVYASRRAPTTDAPNAASPTAPSASSTAPIAASTIASVAPPPASTSNAPSKVTLHVDAGGLAVEQSIGGDWVQVCGKGKACDVAATNGEVVALRATNGTNAGAEKKVLADGDQGVTLAAPAGKVVAAPPPKPSTSQTTLCEVMVDEIKVLRPCPK